MQILSLLSLSLLVSGCAHQSLVAANDSKIVGEILDQVNVAIAEAKASQTTPNEGPDISSVQVDLQLGTNTTANAGFPIGLLFPTAQADQQDLHKVSLTFAPKTMTTTASGAHPDHNLTIAIEEIYRSVSQANPAYQFQHGTMQIQCTLQVGVSASIGSSGGSGGSSSSEARSPQATSSSLLLIPIQAGASQTKQSIQTVTLNFGPHQAETTPASTPTTSTSAPAATTPATAEAPKSL